jgi:hypothetical protein
MLLQAPTLLAITVAAIVIAGLVAMFFIYATGEGPGS